jgi:hypothetical protein
MACPVPDSVLGHWLLLSIRLLLVDACWAEAAPVARGAEACLAAKSGAEVGPGAGARLLDHDGHLTLLASAIGAVRSWLAWHS